MKLAEQLEIILENRIAQDSLTLPLLPAIVAKANEVVRRPDATAKDFVTIELDPILAAVVLRHGRPQDCRTLEQPSGKIGVQKVRSILAEASAHRVTESRDPKTAEATRMLWDHSRAVAILAQNVAILAGVEEPDVCFVAGLLHDIGKPVVATMLLEAEAQIAQRNPKLWRSTATRGLAWWSEPTARSRRTWPRNGNFRKRSSSRSCNSRTTTPPTGSPSGTPCISPTPWPSKWGLPWARFQPMTTMRWSWWDGRCWDSMTRPLPAWPPMPRRVAG
jgi:hypothetical protein